jgi:SagB-type dehydrogenase family enzyme
LTTSFRSRTSYPSGGSIHDLDLYPVIVACRGIRPGLYRYDPVSHRLHYISSINNADGLALIDGASATCAGADVEILLLLVARFRPVLRKYEGMAYALILKNVGVLYQTMYLTATATAMAIGACALGGGDVGSFTRLARTDLREKNVVGEFLIGRRP